MKNKKVIAGIIIALILVVVIIIAVVAGNSSHNNKQEKETTTAIENAAETVGNNTAESTVAGEDATDSVPAAQNSQGAGADSAEKNTTQYVNQGNGDNYAYADALFGDETSETTKKSGEATTTKKSENSTTKKSDNNTTKKSDDSEQSTTKGSGGGSSDSKWTNFY